MRRHFNCPRCNRRLPATGVASVGDEQLAVFQCDECVDPWELEPAGSGKVIPCAFTFAVDAEGRPLDADTGEPM